MGSKYKVEFLKSTKKLLRSIPRQDLVAIFRKIDGLENDPRPSGCTKLSGKFNIYRIRYGNYRICYEIHDDRLVVVIVKVGHRRDIYD